MKSALDYENHERSDESVIYFVLDTSRTEPAARRVALLFSLARATKDDRLSHDITTLANDLADADKIVQDYVSYLRDAYASELRESDAFAYFLDRVEQEPFRQKIELLSPAVAFANRPGRDDSSRFASAYDETLRFEQGFEALLAKIRGGFYHGLNRDAFAREQSEAGNARAVASSA